MKVTDKIAAVVLAAGLSKRMGVPKMALPWRGSTVLGAVLATLSSAGITSIRVVLGGNREEVEKAIDNSGIEVEQVVNPDFVNGEMLDSIRVGLKNLDPELEAVLIVLGDQPQLEARVVEALVARYLACKRSLIVPSYQLRRGHPWMVGKSLWGELLGLAPGETMRDFLKRHAEEIEYLEVDTPSVLQDLDTPEDYQNAKKQV